MATPVLTYGFKGSANAVLNVFVASEPKKPQEQKCSIYNFIEKFIINKSRPFMNEVRTKGDLRTFPDRNTGRESSKDPGVPPSPRALFSHLP